MDVMSLTLFQGMKAKMDWLNQRQTVLSLNVANADTPGYQPKDLESFDFSQHVSAASLAPKKTHAAHLSAPAAAGGSRSETDKRPYEVAPDGNSVVLEEQMLKSTQTAMDYQLMTNLYTRNMGMLRMALARGR